MMRSGGDGVEVAATLTEAADWPLAPLLVLDRLTAWLDARDLGTGDLRWQRIGDGHSNLTYRIQRDRLDVVLRRGPRPPLPRSAHDMVREARIQALLASRGVPTPTILETCDDDTVLGVPFYLMDWLDGVVLTDTIPPSLDQPDERRNTSFAAVDALVALHAVELDDEVGRLGRPDGYLQRQVHRFSQLWEANSRRELPQVQTLARWLDHHLPETQRHSVVHGDYRLGNLMLAADAPARVSAVLDWEMATLGDPLADLGYLTATYADPSTPATVMELSPVTRLDHYARTIDIEARYADATGLDLTDLPWYQALALWKSAVFCEAMYTRWLNGERPGDTFAPSLESGVPRLLEAATERARQRLSR